jgi:hypothetical protein
MLMDAASEACLWTVLNRSVPGLSDSSCAHARCGNNTHLGGPETAGGSGPAVVLVALAFAFAATTAWGAALVTSAAAVAPCSGPTGDSGLVAFTTGVPSRAWSGLPRACGRRRLRDDLLIDHQARCSERLEQVLWKCRRSKSADEYELTKWLVP